MMILDFELSRDQIAAIDALNHPVLEVIENTGQLLWLALHSVR
jgi:hypothetical protein